MDFLKKHYEKILLGVVLLGLVAGAVFLIFMIPAERAKLDEQSKSIINRPPKPLPPLEIGKQEQALKELQASVTVDLASNHKVFNPMLWRKKPPPENTPIKDLPRNVGPQAILVTKIAPLHLNITLESVSTAESGARYVIGVERESAPNPNNRKKKLYYATLNNKNDTFILREVKGSPDDVNSLELKLELNDTSEQVWVKKATPYKRVDAYTADLKYPPDNNKAWNNSRNNAQLKIEGEDYNIVVIRKDEVILSAKLNDKKTTIPYTAAP